MKVEKNTRPYTFLCTSPKTARQFVVIVQASDVSEGRMIAENILQTNQPTMEYSIKTRGQ